jgi:hypothetical protein
MDGQPKKISSLCAEAQALEALPSSCESTAAHAAHLAALKSSVRQGTYRAEPLCIAARIVSAAQANPGLGSRLGL